MNKQENIFNKLNQYLTEKEINEFKNSSNNLILLYDWIKEGKIPRDYFIINELVELINNYHATQKSYDDF